MLRKLDLYIIKKFFGTFFLTMILLIIIVIVFDITEKLDDFIDGKIPLSEILFVYYLNFIPYFAILFTPLFLFIAVIFFTSRLAARSEIIAMMNSGITFNRLLVPYFVSAGIVTAANIYANNWIVPAANKHRVSFEFQYIDYHPHTSNHNIHMQIAKDQFIYLENFSFDDSSGYKFSFEKFSGRNLIYKMKADRLFWNGKKNSWQLKNYVARVNNGMYETLSTGKDTLVAYKFRPVDFQEEEKSKDAMNARELNREIAKLKLAGADNVAVYEVEKYKRTAFPFAILILTLIGVSLASRRVRGGTGIHVGFGICLSFTYIFFQQFSQTYSIKSNLPPIIGVWIPNILFLGIALLLFRSAKKNSEFKVLQNILHKFKRKKAIR